MNIEQDETISQPPPPDANKKALAREAFGMWANRADLDKEWLKAGRERWYSAWLNNEEGSQDFQIAPFEPGSTGVA